MDFATLIKAARERDKLSQSQAAAKWGIPLKTLQGWEQEQRQPGAKHLEKLLPILFPSPAPKKRRR